MDGLARLPPLRETIAAHGLDARKRLGQHFLLDLNLTRRIARAAAPLAAGNGDRGRARSGRPDPRPAAGGGRPRRRHRSRPPGRRPPCRNSSRRRAGAAAGGPGRCAEGRPGRLSGRAPRRIVANLPYNVSTALLVALAAPGRRRRRHGADVPEGGGRPAGGPAAQQGLRPPLGAGPACLRRAAPVRRRALGLRAAAQGHFLGRAADATSPPTAVWPICGPWKGSLPPPSASAARCCAARCAGPFRRSRGDAGRAGPLARPPGPRSYRWPISCRLCRDAGH